MLSPICEAAFFKRSAGQLEGKRLADTVRGAGHDHDLVLKEAAVHVYPRFVQIHRIQSPQAPNPPIIGLLFAGSKPLIIWALMAWVGYLNSFRVKITGNSSNTRMTVLKIALKNTPKNSEIPVASRYQTSKPCKSQFHAHRSRLSNG